MEDRRTRQRQPGAERHCAKGRVAYTETPILSIVDGLFAIEPRPNGTNSWKSTRAILRDGRIGSIRISRVL